MLQGVGRTLRPQRLTFAGIYNVFSDELTTMSFVTGPSPEKFAEIHHRMPAILMKDDCDRWLDPGTSEADLLAMLTPWTGPWEPKLETKGTKPASLFE